MLGTILGSYRIEAELGSGGMGTVYLATAVEDTGEVDAGTQVALKVIHPHLLGRPGFLRRFMQEARVGRRVRHVNVVSTYELDADERDGQVVLFLVMEHVVGRTLRSLLHELRQVPETLLRELARQVAAGLAAIHEAGFVHRDLKPENVLVTSGHEVRIMDLGVARLLEGGPCLTEEGHFAGSLLYAAPEQFGAGSYGAPVDLYALGAMLYELAAGHNPFHRPDTGAILRAHLEVQPRPLVDLGVEISPFFSELVDRLLAKDPAGRFPSAAFVRDLLTAGERSPWWASRQQELAARRLRRPRVPVPRETPLHGRGDDLATLRAAWEEARAGRGTTVLLEGEPGIGKSRLLDSFMDEVAAGEAHVLYGAYHPGAPMGGLSAAIVEHFGSARLEEALLPYVAHAPALAPSYAAVLRHDPQPPEAPQLKGDALHALTVYVMRGLAAQKPVLWVVDDLQFAGPDSRAVAVAMARAVEGHRVLLVVATRPDLPAADLEPYTRLANVRRLALRRLSPREVIELLRDALQSHAVADRLGGTVAYKSDGVPLFVLEMVRGLKESGLLRQEPDGSFVTTQVVDAIEVPSAVRDLVQARLSRLDREDRDLLDVAAVQGYEFDAGLVARVLGRKRIPVLQSLAELERRTGIVRASGRLMRFDHHQVQEVLYRGLPDALRVEYHAALAEAYALDLADGGDTRAAAGEHAVFLATHHLSGSRPREALPHLQRALDHLESCYRNEALADLAEKALAQPGLLDPEAQVGLLLRRAERLGYLGHVAAAGRDLQRAEEAAGAAPARHLAPLVRTRAGWSLLRQSRYPEAEAVLGEAQRLAHDRGDARVESMATEHLGVVSYARADYQRARACFERARDLAHAAGDLRAEAQATGGMGVVLRAQGRLEQARRCHESHLAMAQEAGDRRGVMNALGNLANLLHDQRRHAEAKETYERGLVVAREIGDRGGQAALEGSLGSLLWIEGRIQEARTKFETSLLLDRELGHREGEARMLLNLGSMWSMLGAWEQAERDDDHALALCRDIGARVLEGHALMGRAGVHRARGQLEDARHLLGHALELFSAIGREAGRSEALHALGGTLADLGETEGARARLQESLALLGPEAGRVERALRLCRLAALPQGDVEGARHAYEEARAEAGAFQRLAMLDELWRATGDEDLLLEGEDLLLAVRRRAPAPWRDTMLEAVPLHHRIHTAAQALARPGAHAAARNDDGPGD